jgi:hypothetical protein
MEVFLLSQKSPSSTFNYWDRKAKDETTRNYPDDLDDTSVCLSALAKIDAKNIDEKTLVSFVNTLIALEEKPGGPYNTWILGDYKNTHWHDIDIAVNANIANFLHSQNITIETLNEFLDRKIKEIKNTKSTFVSNYYHKNISVIYFLSKSYRGIYIKKLLNILERDFLNPEKFKKQNAQDLAQGISSFIRLGGDLEFVEKPLAFLIKNQNADGTFPWSEFFVEEIKNGEVFYSGCEAFSTACAIEAMELYNHRLEQIPLEQEKLRLEKFSKKIQGFCEKRFSTSPKEMHMQFSAFVSKLAASDTHHEISLLPYFYFDGLKQRFKKKITRREIFKLCEANLFGWVAYTIYDAVIDGEKKEGLIPLANICMREVVSTYREFLGKKDFEVAKKILDEIEHANLREHNTCRFPIIESKFEIPKILPDYKNLKHLAFKSLGHALGPISLSTKIDGKKSTLLLEQFFMNYLIARQFNDDAHDWLGDLREGFVNPAAKILLVEFKKTFPDKKILDLSENSNDVVELQKMFWDSTVEKTSREILVHAKRAKKIARNIPELASTQYLDSLLVRLESSAKSAISERDKTRKFLNAYG